MREARELQQVTLFHIKTLIAINIVTQKKDIYIYIYDLNDIYIYEKYVKMMIIKIIRP